MNRLDFPMIKEWIMFDNAAMTFKPKIMISTISNFYKQHVSNPHSINSSLSTYGLNTILDTRILVAQLVKCDFSEVIFTSGTNPFI